MDFPKTLHETPARARMRQFLLRELAPGPRTYKELRAKAREHGFGVKLMLLVADFLRIRRRVTGFGPDKVSLWSLPKTIRELPPSEYIPFKKILQEALDEGPILEDHLIAMARSQSVDEDSLFLMLDEIGARETIRKRSRGNRYSIWWVN